MAINSNVFSQGSGGAVYEIEVQTNFLISFLLGLNIPGVLGKIEVFKQQSASLGFHTDDLLLKCAHPDRKINVLFQIKHNLVISAAGETFKQVINDAWRDFHNGELFDPALDKIFIVKSQLTKDEKNHLNVILDWSRAKSNADDFIQEVDRIKAKKTYLDMFRSIINESFPGTLDDELLHRFCRTLYFLELDFAQDASSDKANCLSLLDQFKTNSDNSPDGLWNDLFTLVASGNYKGAIYEINRLPGELHAKLSRQDSSALLTALKLWSAQNYEVVEMTDNTIGDYTLPRADLLNTIEQAFYSSNTIVISGNPGLGKSALAKSWLNDIRQTNSGMVLCFKADELGEGNLRDYFARYSIHRTLKEIFSLFGTLQHNIVYVDALEKLLEYTGTAFYQLLLAVKELPNVKLMISCRQSSLALLDLKFLSQIGYYRVDISELSDNELYLVAENIPLLKPLMENLRLKPLLRIPKYLDFTHRAIKINGKVDENFDEEAFKGYLWQTIIENKINEFQDGFPARRCKVFLDISVKRSKKMQPFVSLDQPDQVVVEKLLKENLIVESKNKGFFAPAHDVLEDWALISHVDFLFNEYSSPDVFFSKLGSEPAMRRAYRLWVNNSLKTGDKKKIGFITKEALSLDTVSYRTDECLIAIMQSEFCNKFFDSNKYLLLNDDYAILMQLIKIMRTACRKNIGDQHSKYYIPTGYGWSAVISLIFENIAGIAGANWETIYKLLKEWSNVLDYESGLNGTTRSAGLIMLYLIEHHITLDYSRNRSGDEEVKLLIRFSGGIQKELKSILEEKKSNGDFDEYDDEDDYQYGERLKAKITKVALSGYPSKQFARYLPETVIALATKHWMHKSSEVYYPKNDHDRMMMRITRSSSSIDINEYFGLKSEDRLDYFPASGIQGPIYWLLKFHPFQTVEFITELSNWCAANYAFSEFGERDELQALELILPDGTVVRQYGSDLLWSVYRGTVKVSPYVWQSALMALEKYLLELCEEGTKNLEQVQQLVDYLIRNSNSVAITGIVSSIFQAHPKFAHLHVSSLYSSRKFISYDITRYVHDQSHTVLNTFNEDHDQERLESDKQPHRQKYQGGLQSFIQGYCFNYGTANQEIFKVLDHHRQLADPYDASWRKRLDEMDIRTWRITKEYQEDEKFGFLIEPSYNEDIKEYVEDLKASLQASDIDSGHIVWLHKVEKGTVEPTLYRWMEIWRIYAEVRTFELMKHRPGLLAEIGVVRLWEELDQDQKTWCEEMIAATIGSRIDKSYNQWDFEGFGSPIDLQSAVRALPVLVCHTGNDKQQDLEKLLLCFLTSPFQYNDPHASDMYQAFGKTVWEKNTTLAVKILNGIIHFSCFFKANSALFFRPKSAEEKEEYEQKYLDLIHTLIDKGATVELSTLDFSRYSVNYLIRAVSILPAVTECAVVFEFVKVINERVMEYKTDRRNYEREEKVGYLRLTLHQKASELILRNSGQLGSGLFEHLLENAHTHFKNVKEGKYESLIEIFTFTKAVIERIIIHADNSFQDEDPAKVDREVSQFIQAWTVFRNYLIRNNVPLFINLLLLDIEVKWKKTSANWKPIEKDPRFFMNNIAIFGAAQVHSVVTLLSHIGEKVLFQEGFKWLVGHLKKTSAIEELILFKDINQLMSRGYYNHLNEIMEDATLLSDYLDMLDILVKHGSSDAYWIREFMISFSGVENAG